ncbi:hypothetical protein DTO027B5_3495 [Paecilomyces variotii]|nr:hypothetical protein DTO032I3_5422 [Paecilomyces variotii]KAJ9276678.1 hypothetical protein DTO021D3_6438 [Paecilomyces variotii]KAJ9288304.1 hypothetical protein DTO021C3_4082 [Paecilomyces variotii]KAJ9321552.1 hypothetical protein DTO027B3_7452 [Paecilomyces variotii]KAJ9334698.1 hypothetical protein DTO027B5_3495 [Paecilomyces variotii]
MGWWWSSSSKDENQTSAKSTLPTSSSRDASKPQETISATAKQMSPDEQVQAEFQRLLAGLESADGSQTSQPAPSEPTSHAQSTEAGIQPSSEPRSSIAPESLYPDEMDCRSAFDYAFFCQSFGGQFVSVYRYGEMRSCSEHWNNFWLCMKARSLPDESRRRMIREHNKKKAIKYKTGPSSEDVWEIRTEPVKNAFQGDFAALEREMKAAEEARSKAQAGAGAAP